MMQLNIPTHSEPLAVAENLETLEPAKARVSGQRAVQHAESEIVRLIQEDGMAPGTMLPGYQDLAQRCGVAPATVQRAIAELATRGIVRSVSRKGTFVAKTLDPLLQRRPHHVSARFQSGVPFGQAKPAKILTIAVLAFIPSDNREFRDQSWAHWIVDGIERAAAADARVMIQLINSWRSATLNLTDEEALDRLTEAQADGQIFIQPDESLLRAARDRHLAASSTVVIADGFNERPITQVYYDSTVAGYQAAAHLIDFGYRRLLFASPFNDAWVQERLAGARRAIADAPHKVTLETLIVEEVPTPLHQFEAGLKLAPSILTGNLQGMAIIAANDGVAHGIARAAIDAGLELGRDFGLIGFDDRPTSRELGITSLRPPLEEMGREALRLLRNSIQTQSVTGHLRLASTLTPRPSTRALST